MKILTNKEFVNGFWTPFFKIGNQKFYLTAQPTKKEASFFVEMMKKAFSKLEYRFDPDVFLFVDERMAYVGGENDMWSDLTNGKHIKTSELINYFNSQKHENTKNT